MIYIVLAVMVLIGFIRTVSFGVWNIKDKNISGGAALILLAVFSTISSVLNLLS